jgi:hypothetical protein
MGKFKLIAASLCFFLIFNFLTTSCTGRNVPAVIAPGWKGVKINSLCLHIIETYEKLPNFSLALFNEYQAFFGSAGIKVTEDNTNCDANLEMIIHGIPYLAHYTGGLGECYTGAFVQSVIRLAAQGHESLEFNLYGTVPTAGAISSCNTKTQAPFRQALRDNEIKWLNYVWGRPFWEILQKSKDYKDYADTQIRYFDRAASIEPSLLAELKDTDSSVRMDALRKIEGTGPYFQQVLPEILAVMGEPDRDLRGEAVMVLEKIGPPMRDAVPILIQYLKNKNYDTDILVGSPEAALNVLTGQRLGPDPAKWEEWWNQQKK